MFVTAYLVHKAAKMTKFKSLLFYQIISSSIKTPPAHFQYVHNMFAEFQKHAMKIVKELITQTSYPTVQKKLPEMTKFKKPYVCHNLVQLHRKPICTFSMCPHVCKVWETSIKTVKSVDYTNNAKIAKND